MRTLLACAAASTIVISLLVAAPAPAADGLNQPPAGFTAIFNGKDLDGWYGQDGIDPREVWKLSPEERAKKVAAGKEDAAKNWRAEKGELVNDGHGLYLTTEKDYGDIELRIDYKTVALADSGIYLRAVPQVQIWDTTEAGGKWNLGADKGSGGLWNNPAGSPGKDPLVKADRPFGEWNSFRILHLGSRVTIHFNDQLVVDGAPLANYYDKKAPLFPKGPIQLQTHGGEIRWRNIFLREIPADEANRLLRGKDPEGFIPVFNGKDFTGWAGPVEGYEVVDGALRCRKGTGGTIFTKEIYTDFVARLEFKLPAGGNNGLAIRYPGQGDTAYVGMCELQVLDDGNSMYATIDPRQAHGSAYGMVPAHRGYLRPVGQWNYQEVTVQGPKIKVELNGTVILDADLSTVTKFMADSAHPGKDRTEGHFGFAGHGDAVEFRNVAIKKLK